MAHCTLRSYLFTMNINGKSTENQPRINRDSTEIQPRIKKMSIENLETLDIIESTEIQPRNEK
ncbi:MAG: hypothetical protein HYZ42_14595 [Bacteroidetes bacterium]|nr:hypothetical protein [Bacteroidota bacterium]